MPPALLLASPRRDHAFWPTKRPPHRARVARMRIRNQRAGTQETTSVEKTSLRRVLLLLLHALVANQPDEFPHELFPLGACNVHALASRQRDRHDVVLARHRNAPLSRFDGRRVAAGQHEAKPIRLGHASQEHDAFRLEPLVAFALNLAHESLPALGLGLGQLAPFEQLHVGLDDVLLGLDRLDELVGLTANDPCWRDVAPSNALRGQVRADWPDVVERILARVSDLVVAERKRLAQCFQARLVYGADGHNGSHLAFAASTCNSARAASASLAPGLSS